MQTVNQIVTEYKTRTGQSYQAIADDMTAILATRPYPPKSITKQAIALWATDSRARPDAARLEYLVEHAEDPDIRELAAALLDAIQVVDPAPAVGSA